MVASIIKSTIPKKINLNFRNRLQYYLVKTTNCSHKQAAKSIQEGLVYVDDVQVFENVSVTIYSKIVLNNELLSNAHNFVYVAYHKPAGIECTYNTSIENNLLDVLPDEFKGLYYVGRLDKASEGLLLLTNDGFMCKKISDPGSHILKKYWVQTEKEISPDFKQKMEKGIELFGKITRPCQLEIIDAHHFYISLTEGMNRQIRRMCFCLGNYVTQLKRISIGEIELYNLKKSGYRLLTPAEISYLKNAFNSV